MKRTPFKKKRRGSFKDKAWTVFSKFIRQREINEHGLTTCFTCGAVNEWHQFHAGHYIPKSISLSLRFDERNVNIQCAGCNTFKHGNLTQYALALKRKYGENILEDLDRDRRLGEGFKISQAGYEEIFNKYSAMIK